MLSLRSIRARLWLASLASAPLGVVAALSGCEDDEPVAREERDAGGPAVEEEDAEPKAEPDAAVEDVSTCDLDADFTAEIPDAAIADGQSTSGFCLACAKKSCLDPIATCNASCACKTVAGGAFTCFATSGGSLVCADAEPLGRAVLSCSGTKCAEQCQTNPFADGGR